MTREREPARAFRCGGELWKAAQEVAAERGESLSLVIRRSLAAYVKRHRSGLPERRSSSPAIPRQQRRDDDPVAG